MLRLGRGEGVQTPRAERGLDGWPQTFAAYESGFRYTIPVIESGIHTPVRDGWAGNRASGNWPRHGATRRTAPWTGNAGATAAGAACGDVRRDHSGGLAGASGPTQIPGEILKPPQQGRQHATRTLLGRARRRAITLGTWSYPLRDYG